MHQVFRNKKNVLKTIIGKVIMRLPFDISRKFSFKIKIQDYYLYFRQSRILIEFWKNPNDRISDYTFIKSYLKSNDIYILILGQILEPH